MDMPNYIIYQDMDIFSIKQKVESECFLYLSHRDSTNGSKTQNWTRTTVYIKKNKIIISKDKQYFFANFNVKCKFCKYCENKIPFSPRKLIKQQYKTLQIGFTGLLKNVLILYCYINQCIIIYLYTSFKTCPDWNIHICITKPPSTTPLLATYVLKPTSKTKLLPIQFQQFCSIRFGSVVSIIVTTSKLWGNPNVGNRSHI